MFLILIQSKWLNVNSILMMCNQNKIDYNVKKAIEVYDEAKKQLGVENE